MLYKQPIVRYGKALINLAQVQYIRAYASNSYGEWKMSIKFSNGELFWTFDNESDAYIAMDQVEQMVQTFVVDEIP